MTEWGLEPGVCNDDETSPGLMSDESFSSSRFASSYKAGDTECLSWTGGGAKAKAGVTTALHTIGIITTSSLGSHMECISNNS